MYEFYTPPHLEENYESFLSGPLGRDVEYCKDISEYPQVWIPERAEVSPINYKSKQYGSDNNLKIRLRRKCSLQKGDMIKYEGRFYLASWRTHDALPDSIATNMEKCNVIATIKRKSEGELDPETGAVITEPGEYTTVCSNVPGIFTINGNYELRHKNSQVGIFVDNRTRLTVQANKETFAIKRGDIFEYHGEVLIVRDLNLTELDVDDTGVITINFGLTSDKEALDG